MNPVNPEPIEIANKIVKDFRKAQQPESEKSTFGTLLVGLWIGFGLGVFWRGLYEWIF